MFDTYDVKRGKGQTAEDGDFLQVEFGRLKAEE